MRVAFSTVACPEWTLEEVSKVADRLGYDGVDLRTFGEDSPDFTPEPALTSTGKLRRLFQDEGLSVCSLGTSVRFDQRINPPVIGLVLGDNERSVREAKLAIDRASHLGCPYVRVFGFELGKREKRSRGIDRIVWRLTHAADHCRHLNVRLLVENGGSFSKATELLEIIDKVNARRVGVCYSPAVARAAGEDPIEGIEAVWPAMDVVKLKDYQGGRPCMLGDGDQDCQSVVEHLARRGFRGWAVCEYGRIWVPELPEPMPFLTSAIERVCTWADTIEAGTTTRGRRLQAAG